MKAISVSVESLKNGTVRATGRHNGRTVISKDGTSSSAKAIFDEVMTETCGAHRIGDRYDLTYIELNQAAAELL